MRHPTADADAVGALITTQAPARPRPLKPTVRPGPASDPGADEPLPELREVRLSMVPSAPPVRPAVPGVPDPEADAAVLEARATASRLSDQLGAALGALERLEAELDVPPGVSPRQLEALAVQLLASGGDDAAVERLRAASARVGRLTQAAAAANARVGAALTEATRRLTGRAREAIVRPADEAVAAAVLPLLAALDRRRLAVDTLQAAGFGTPDGLFAQIDANTLAQSDAVETLLRMGLLTREQVRAACPHMPGI